MSHLTERFGKDLRRLIDAAEEALDAYEDRFESTKGKGNYVGPIDEEMKALRRALKNFPKIN